MDIFASIKKVNEDEQIVYGVVYPAYILDTASDFTSPEALRKCAHEFMERALQNRIDTGHDEKPNGSYAVESWFQENATEDYPADSWVIGVKVPVESVWKKVKDGELNGFSISMLAKGEPVVVEISVDKVGISETYPGGSDGHTHLFVMFRDDDGRVVEGRTSTDAGHSHAIKRGTATEKSYGHGHRIDELE